MKKVFLHICTIVLAIVLWPFAITGAVSYFISGMRFNRWVSSGLSLCLAVTLRVTTAILAAQVTAALADLSSALPFERAAGLAVLGDEATMIDERQVIAREALLDKLASMIPEALEQLAQALLQGRK